MHWLDALSFGIPVAIILAIAWANRKRQPLRWLAWAIDAVVRLFASFGTVLLCMAGWVAWRGGYVAVAEVDWATWGFIAAVTAVVLWPVVLLLDVSRHVKRRRKARVET